MLRRRAAAGRRRTRSRLATVILVGAAIALAAIAFRRPASPTPSQSAPHLTSPPARPSSATAVLQVLDQLPVLPARPHIPGYQRGCGTGQACSFGPAWTDNTPAAGGHNGCDTRNDVLRAQLADPTLKPGSRCIVVAGTLHDPYTATTITFAKAHAGVVQIDHIVPLALAWDLGAAKWTQAQRTTYANDEQLVLLAASGTANEAKGDSGPGEWMPPNRGDWCTYATRIVQVLDHYQLPVTAPDKSAMTHALATCDATSGPRH